MSGDNTDTTLFSRGETTGELRGDTPKWILAALDGVSMANNKSRIALVNEILAEWAKGKIHEATVLNRLMRDYPQVAEASGKVGD